MSFISFLQEYTNHGKIVLQQILDNLDDSHIDYDKEKIEINVGNIIKKSKYSNLIIVIYPNKASFSVKFGRSKKAEEYVIVIATTEEVPKRKEVDSFISDHDNVYNGILSNMNKYFDKKDFSDNKKTSYESTSESNNDESFEKMYDDITKTTNNKLKEYNTLKAKLKGELATTNNASKKHTLELALNKLKKDILGNSLGEFTKKIYSAIDSEAIKNLESTFKAKLSSRISSLYDNKISNLS